MMFQGRYNRTAVLFLQLALSTIFLNAAVAEVYVDDANLELSGSGARKSRSCTAVIKPKLASDATQVPQLVITTFGLDRISFGLKDASRYYDAVIVQDNVRRTLVPGDRASVQLFQSSDLARALRSDRLFFVTARTIADSQYVSSRYEGVDFRAILEKIEAFCPFDAESMMSDVSDRQQRERALSVSSSDLALIVWALNKRYGYRTEKPSPQSSLSETERTYLKRYAVENDQPASGYLTPSLVARLRAEGEKLEQETRKPPPEPIYSDYFTFHLCNKSKHHIALAVAHRQSPTDNNLVVAGWWIVKKGECTRLTYPKGWFYFYGEKRNSGGKVYWGGNDLKLCIKYPGPFERVNTKGYTCKSNQLKGFIGRYIEKEQDIYEFNMN